MKMIKEIYILIGILALFLAMIPIWPITGNWFGVPAWAVFALLVSILTSLFVAVVILRVWKDPDDQGEHND